MTNKIRKAEKLTVMYMSPAGNRKKKGSRIYLTEREKEILKDVGGFILSLALAGLVIGVALVAPNSLQIAKLFIKRNPRKFKDYSEKEVSKIIAKIFKDRLVELVERDGEQMIKITQRGKCKLINYNINTIQIKKCKWDGKWRLVIFDIPEKMRVARDILRSKLKEIGFIRVQKSVWASPYECQDEISFIASVYEVEKYVNYVVAERMDFSQSLRLIFKV